MEIHTVGKDTFLKRHGLEPDTIEKATAMVAEAFVRVFGRTSVFSDDWPEGVPRLEEVRKDVINHYLKSPLR